MRGRAWSMPREPGAHTRCVTLLSPMQRFLEACTAVWGQLPWPLMMWPLSQEGPPINFDVVGYTGGNREES